VFYDVKQAQIRHKKLIEQSRKKQEKKKVGPPSPTESQPAPQNERLNKTVSVFLSANTTLYGDLISRIFLFFIEKIKNDNSDIIIIGRLGRRLYEEQGLKRPYLYFELTDREITLEQLKPVIFHLVKYEKILVYYGRFDSIATQTPTVSNVSGDQPFPELEKPRNLEGRLGTEFLFEPSLELISRFFEELIASSLFHQTIDETQLARLGARIMSMERAQQNIEQDIRKLHSAEIKVSRLEQNRKQLDRLAGKSLWSK
jgi:F0F1-type ATP synthase gamma subunit